LGFAVETGCEPGELVDVSQGVNHLNHSQTAGVAFDQLSEPKAISLTHFDELARSESGSAGECKNFPLECRDRDRSGGGGRVSQNGQFRVQDR
jgi:hypothetical protein